jgi:hypothetical protein
MLGSINHHVTHYVCGGQSHSACGRKAVINILATSKSETILILVLLALLAAGLREILVDVLLTRCHHMEMSIPC